MSHKDDQILLQLVNLNQYFESRFCLQLDSHTAAQDSHAMSSRTDKNRLRSVIVLPTYGHTTAVRCSVFIQRFTYSDAAVICYKDGNDLNEV